MAEGVPFARKAAKFSWLAPLGVVALNFATTGIAKLWFPITILVGIISALLILAGVVASVVALAGLSRHGRTGILWPALTGLMVNLLAIALAVWVYLLASAGGVPSLEDLEIKPRLVGEWESKSDGLVVTIRLSADGQFWFTTTGWSRADVSGTWAVQNRRLILNVGTIRDGDPERIGKALRWPIEKFEADELVLGSREGSTRYTRKR